jgi:hypothetical protein
VDVGRAAHVGEDVDAAAGRGVDEGEHLVQRSGHVGAVRAPSATISSAREERGGVIRAAILSVSEPREAVDAVDPLVSLNHSSDMSLTKSATLMQCLRAWKLSKTEQAQAMSRSVEK